MIEDPPARSEAPLESMFQERLAHVRWAALFHEPTKHMADQVSALTDRLRRMADMAFGAVPEAAEKDVVPPLAGAADELRCTLDMLAQRIDRLGTEVGRIA